MPSAGSGAHRLRIGLLSDAHGNHLWFSSCLEALRRLDVQFIFFLGDAGGYLPGLPQVLLLLVENSVRCQLGNHDAMLVGRMPIAPEKDRVYRLRQARASVSAVDIAMIAQWPQQRIELLGGRRVLLVHGSPREPLEGYVYPDTDCAGFGALPYEAIFMGNTHYPFVKRVADKLLVNVGSCGLPRDQGNAPAFAVYECENNRAEIYRLRRDPRQLLYEFRHDEPAEEVMRCLYRDARGPIVGRFIEEIVK